MEAAIAIVSGLVLVVTALNVHRAPGAPAARTLNPRLFLLAVGGLSVLVGVGYVVFGGAPSADVHTCGRATRSGL